MNLVLAKCRIYRTVFRASRAFTMALRAFSLVSSLSPGDEPNDEPLSLFYGFFGLRRLRAAGDRSILIRGAVTNDSQRHRRNPLHKKRRGGGAGGREGEVIERTLCVSECTLGSIAEERIVYVILMRILFCGTFLGL